jgi:ABC-type spermidine/putrescine transport system permease subunit II
VPSIVYGILGLGLFVRAFMLGRSLIAGELTLSLVVLTIVIVATQESLQSVPDSIRHASYALGATRWQTVRRQVLPAALPGIMTGVILALSRAIGEAAPLVAVGAVAYVPFVPSSPLDQFTALPILIFNWTGRPQSEFHRVAAAGIVVLLIVLVCMNAVAVVVRHRYGSDAAGDRRFGSLPSPAGQPGDARRAGRDADREVRRNGPSRRLGLGRRRLRHQAVQRECLSGTHQSLAAPSLDRHG